MSTQYLLPCPKCPPGTFVVVDAQQAGLTVQCTCGAELQAPTLRGLRQLARAEERAAAPSSDWTWREAIFFLGVVMSVLTLPMYGYLYLKTPPHPSTLYAPPPTRTPDGAHIENDEIARMNVEQLWSKWDSLKEGPDTGGEIIYILGWERQMAKHATFYYVVNGVLGAGLALSVIGGTTTLVRRSTKKS